MLWLLTAVVSIVMCCDCYSAVNPIEGDLNDDGVVDYRDVSILAQHWLDPNCETDNCIADVGGGPGVDTSDFAIVAQNWHRGSIPLVINEFMASNSSTIKDPQGEYDDWIEIYNSGDYAIDMGGMYLTDDVEEPTKWRIPQDKPDATTVPVDRHIVIWADRETEG